VFRILIALALNLDFRGRGLIRAAILIRFACPTIVAVQVWKCMLKGQFGINNDIDDLAIKWIFAKGNRTGRSAYHFFNYYCAKNTIKMS